MLNELSPWHLIIVLLLFAVLFGSKRLPDAARGLGRSMRIFKAEMHSAKEEFPAEAAPAAAGRPFARRRRHADPAGAAPQDAVPPAAAFAAEPAEPVAED